VSIAIPCRVLGFAEACIGIIDMKVSIHDASVGILRGVLGFHDASVGNCAAKLRRCSMSV